MTLRGWGGAGNTEGVRRSPSSRADLACSSGHLETTMSECPSCRLSDTLGGRECWSPVGRPPAKRQQPPALPLSSFRATSVMEWLYPIYSLLHLLLTSQTMWSDFTPTHQNGSDQGPLCLVAGPKGTLQASLVCPSSASCPTSTHPCRSLSRVLAP